MEPAFLYDDAYITLASAQALWRGQDTAFPGTPPLYGITSPVHFAIVAALLPVLPPAWALLVSSLTGTMAYAAGLWWLGRHEGLPRVEAGGLVAAGLGAGMISQHLVNGLETSWALAAVSWLLWASRARALNALALIAGVAPFVRPELAVVSATLLALAAWQAPRRTLRLAICAAAAAAPWLLLLATQTGSIVPSTLAAKRDWYAEGCWPLTQRLSVVGEGVTGWIWGMPALTVGLWGLMRTATGRVLALSFATVLVVWSWSVPNVLHAYQRHRYYAVFLPGLVLGLMQLPRWLRPVVVGAAALMAVVSTTAVVRLEPAAIARAMDMRVRTNLALAGTGAERVMLHDAGHLAYSGAMPTGIDIVGLKTPLAARLHAELTGPSCGAGRGEAIARLAGATDPTHLVIWEPWDEHFRVTASLRDAGWELTHVETVKGVEPIHVFQVRPGARTADEKAADAGLPDR